MRARSRGRGPVTVSVLMASLFVVSTLYAPARGSLLVDRSHSNDFTGMNPSPAIAQQPPGSFPVASPYPSFSRGGDQPAECNATTPGCFPVDFYPYGLSVGPGCYYGNPSCNNYTVVIGGQAQTGNIATGLTFYEPNGTYSYSATCEVGCGAFGPVAGFVSVDGQPPPATSVAWGWIGFEAYGDLPAATPFSVTLNGATASSLEGGLGFHAPFSINGAYSYSVTPIPGYTTTYMGLVDVINGSGSVALTFSVMTYSVTFTETGLDPVDGWFVDLNGSTYSSFSDTLTVNETNGTYPFSVYSYTERADPSIGVVTVSGQSAVIQISFAPVLYDVTFVETGLPSGSTWKVTLNGTEATSSTDTIEFQEANGSYPYAVQPVPGYTASPSSGSISVYGAGLSERINFTPSAGQNYTVTFSETGLPEETFWSVTIGAQLASTTSPFLQFGLANGDYQFLAQAPGYSFDPDSGTFTVDGGPLTIHLVATPYLWEVSFVESGVLPGDAWTVTFNGSTQSSVAAGPTDEIDFSAENGTYEYAIDCGPLYLTDPTEGHLTVGGMDVAIGVTCTPLFTVTFEQSSESQAPEDSPWSVVFDGTVGTAMSGDGAIDFNVTEGMYRYSIGSLPGFVPSMRSGEVIVTDNDVSVEVTFLQVNYVVAVNETGLPHGVNWAITLNGTPYVASAGYPVVARFPNGTYDYELRDVPGYHQDTVPYQGAFFLNGTGISVLLDFHLQRYSVAFVEQGLPNGTSWSVNVSEVGNFTNRTFEGNGTILVELPNGTYDYRLGNLTAFQAAPVNGTVVVQDDGPEVDVGFLATFPVTFLQTGIPNGTAWTVEATMLSAVATGATGAVVGMSWFANSTGPDAILHLVNGSYLYVVTAPGYQTRSGGPFTVSGSPEALPPVVVYPVASSSGVSVWVDAAIGIVIAGAVAGLGIVLVRRRRPPSMAPPERLKAPPSSP